MRTFHVVTQRNWMADELTAALTPAGWEVRQHHGLSALPAAVGHDLNQVLWAPGAFAAREIAYGNALRLAAPGPRWLDDVSGPFHVDGNLTCRRVRTLSCADALSEPQEGFWKLAETKLDLFKAKWRTADELAADVARARIPDESLLQHTDTLLTVIREFRAIANDGAVTAISCYLDNKGRDRAHPDFNAPHPVVLGTARHIADVYAEIIAQQCPAGPAYALDLASTTAGWAVIEVNPVWSSAWYGCDLVAFADAVARAQGPAVPDEFLWRPDPILLRSALRAGPLPHDRISS